MRSCGGPVWSCQKENGPCTVQEKKRFRDERAFWVPGKSLPAAWVAREFGGPGHPALLFSKVASAGPGGQAFQLPPALTAGVYTRGRPIRGTSPARAGRWCRFGGTSLEQPLYLSELAPCAQVPRQRFFSWTAPPPVLFLPPQKENGGWNSCWQSQHFFILAVTNAAIRTLIE